METTCHQINTIQDSSNYYLHVFVSLCVCVFAESPFIQSEVMIMYPKEDSLPEQGVEPHLFK